MKKLTFITVCKNEVDRIERAAISLCNQNSDQFEWIIVDGNSTDGTLDKLHPYEKIISKLVSEPDNSIYDAMNKGIKLSSDGYLLFLNAGDYLADSMVVSDFVNRAESADIILGNIIVKFPSGKTKYRKSTDPIVNIPDGLYRRSFMHQATFFNRKIFKEYGLYDTRYKIAGDYEFYVRCLIKYNASFSSWDRLISIYTQDGKSSNPKNKTLICEKKRLRRKYFPLKYRMTVMSYNVIRKLLNKIYSS